MDGIAHTMENRLLTRMSWRYSRTVHPSGKHCSPPSGAPLLTSPPSIPLVCFVTDPRLYKHKSAKPGGVIEDDRVHGLQNRRDGVNDARTRRE